MHCCLAGTQHPLRFWRTHSRNASLPTTDATARASARASLHFGLSPQHPLSPLARNTLYALSAGVLTPATHAACNAAQGPRGHAAACGADDATPASASEGAGTEYSRPVSVAGPAGCQASVRAGAASTASPTASSVRTPEEEGGEKMGTAVTRPVIAGDAADTLPMVTNTSLVPSGSVDRAISLPVTATIRRDDLPSSFCPRVPSNVSPRLFRLPKVRNSPKVKSQAIEHDLQVHVKLQCQHRTPATMLASCTPSSPNMATSMPRCRAC